MPKTQQYQYFSHPILKHQKSVLLKKAVIVRFSAIFNKNFLYKITLLIPIFTNNINYSGYLLRNITKLKQKS